MGCARVGGTTPNTCAKITPCQVERMLRVHSIPWHRHHCPPDVGRKGSAQPDPACPLLLLFLLLPAELSLTGSIFQQLIHGRMSPLAATPVMGTGEVTSTRGGHVGPTGFAVGHQHGLGFPIPLPCLLADIL